MRQAESDTAAGEKTSRAVARISGIALTLLLAAALSLSPAAAQGRYGDLSGVGVDAAQYDEALALLTIRMGVDALGYRDERANAAGFCHDTMEAAGIAQICDVKGVTVTRDGQSLPLTLAEDEKSWLQAIVYSMRLTLAFASDNGVASLAVHAANLFAKDDLVEKYRQAVEAANQGFAENPCAMVGLARNRLGEPVVTLVFRGTHDAAGALADAATISVGGVHLGFLAELNIFSLVAENAVSFDLDGETVRLKDLIARAADGEAIHFFVGGHSMGGALAQMYVQRLVELGVPMERTLAYTFAAPLAYDISFWDGKDVDDYPIFGVVNTLDIVPRVGVTRTFLLDSLSDALLYLTGRGNGLGAGESTSGRDPGQITTFTAGPDQFGLPYRSFISNHQPFLYECWALAQYNNAHPNERVARRAEQTIF